MSHIVANQPIKLFKFATFVFSEIWVRSHFPEKFHVTLRLRNMRGDPEWI